MAAMKSKSVVTKAVETTPNRGPMPVLSARSKPPLRVVVLSGGDSAEREISLHSGAAVAAALSSAGHQVTAIDPAECPLCDVAWDTFDVCFVALHGAAGEDGRVQQELESLGIPFTGSGSQACRLAMSKSAAKEQFCECEVPTLPFASIGPDETVEDVAKRVAALGFPLIVKPDSQGSSIGVAVAQSPADLAGSVAEARRYDDRCIVEPLVAGREFTVAVLDDRALPMIEIITPERIFSYEAKYQSSLTEYRFKFKLSPASRAKILHAAVAAAKALGTCGLARVDLMLSHDARLWVLEVNTVPGMSARSLAPQAAARAGLDMAALCDLLVRNCLATSGVS